MGNTLYEYLTGEREKLLMKPIKPLKNTKKQSPEWSAGDNAEVLANLKDFDKSKKYYEDESHWSGQTHELACQTAVNLRRKPCVNMTYGFAVKALKRAKPDKHEVSRICTKLFAEEALDVLDLELRLMKTGEGQIYGRKLGNKDLITRSGIVRNILVDVLGAEWPNYHTMVEETGHVPTLYRGTHGDRGKYNKE